MGTGKRAEDAQQHGWRYSGRILDWDGWVGRKRLSLSWVLVENHTAVRKCVGVREFLQGDTEGGKARQKIGDYTFRILQHM